MAGGEANAMAPADLHVRRPMGRGATTWMFANLFPGLKNSGHKYWFLLVVSALVLINNFAQKNQLLINSMLAVIPVFLVLLYAICLIFDAVIKQETYI